MTRKKKKTVIILIIVILILILGVSGVLLYLNTDMFKSNAILFGKYIGQNTQNMEEMYNIFEPDEYANKLKENKYINETEIKVNYTENMGTSSENTKNAINNLKLTIDGQTDRKDGYNYQNVNLLNNEDNVVQIEYTQRDNTYGIRFSDLFNQYILVDNSNLKELFEKMDYSEQEVNEVSDEIQVNEEIDSIKFSEEELETLSQKYLGIIGSGFSKDNFSKKSNQVIKINNKDVNTNVYILKMTKEQLNDTYIKILEELKQDDIILSKLDKIQEIGKLYTTLNSVKENSLKEEFVEEIEDKIEEINSNNIGQDETRVEVYENNKATIRTSIITNEYRINYDWLQEENNKYAQISMEDTTTDEENKQSITIKKENENIKIEFEEKSEENAKTISFEENKKVNGEKQEKSVKIKYEDSNNKVELNAEQKNSIVEKFEKELTLNDENSVKLNQLEEQELKEIMNKITTATEEKINQLKETIKIDDLTKVLNAIGVVKEKDNIEGQGISETEKNRFNSQFELLKAENLEKKDVINMIDIIKNNLIGIEVTSNTTLKLKISRNEYNEEISQTLTKYIENMKNEKYDISIEYDEQTGLVKYVVLNIVDQD